MNAYLQGVLAHLRLMAVVLLVIFAGFPPTGTCQDALAHLKLPEAYGSNDWRPAQPSVYDLAFNVPGIAEGELPVSEVTAIAEKGSSLAQRTLGIWYATGKLWYADSEPVVRDPDQSAKWFKLAAEKNDAVAENGLGIAYLYGLGVPKDPATAIKWFRNSSEAGCPAARINLGCCLLFGMEGTPVNRDEGIRWLKAASGQRQFRARKDLSEIYLHGGAGMKNYFLAYYWFHKAVEVAPAQERTGMMVADWIIRIGAALALFILLIIALFIVGLFRRKA
jgi:TPR repeat protein